MKTRLTFTAISAVLAVALAGCGERPQVVEYKQGTYSGKPDNPPWDGARFGGNKQAWERIFLAKSGSVAVIGS